MAVTKAPTKATTENQLTTGDPDQSTIDPKNTSKTLTTKTSPIDFLSFTLEPDKTKSLNATEQIVGDRPSLTTITGSSPTVVDQWNLGSEKSRDSFSLIPSIASVLDTFSRDSTSTSLKGFNSISFSRDNTPRGTNRDDYATGSNRDDIFSGRDGDDVIFGNDGEDTLFGNADEDTIDGGEDDDWILGGQDDDLIDGKEGNDIITGNRGDDVLIGDNDEDVLYGGQGDDLLYGGKGRDILTGDVGRDRLNGGLETDAFVFREATTAESPEGADIIEDFTPSEGDRVYILATSASISPSDIVLIQSTANFGSIEVDGRATPIIRAAVNILHAPSNRYLGVVTSTTETIDTAIVGANLAIVTSAANIQV
ncbi:MAG: calcium-binding protein [Oscillatoriales cyanobacterium]|nr:MAG: calcium-binding protein [Oscillatoriales cyanobacterium]